MKAEELIQFEKEVKQMYLDGKLRSPVHLSGGNEKQLIRIFKQIKSNDWVFTTYRSHYHALLKGVPKEKLKDWILDNKSIHYMDSEYKVFSSAIVGGTLPIALGVAMAIKRKKKDEKVYCFVGDMTASLGTFWDCIRYAIFNELPIKFIVENNGLSTDTLSKEAWGSDAYLSLVKALNGQYLEHYYYKRIYPHYGVGVFVDFDDKNKQKEDKGF